MICFKEQFNKYFLTSLAALAFIFLLNIPSAKAVLYNPGETLNPACSPTDTDCDVRAAVTVPDGATAGSLVYASSTDIYSSLTIGGNGQVLKVENGGLKWSDDNYINALGVSGGQTIIGGTVANNALVIQANSAVSGNTETSPAIEFKVGNSGNTEALTILNNGNLNINGNINIAGDIIPTTDVAYSLGSPTKFWKDVYIGPGSLYVNGQKVLQTDINENVTITADSNQSLVLKTSGTGDIEINPSGSGQILLKGDLRLSSDKRFVGVVNFDNLNFTDNTITARNTNGGIYLTPNGIGGTYITNGDFGIGTTSPAEKLDVVGNIKLSGALMPAGLAGSSGQVLTSHGSGAASQWSTLNTNNWDTAYGWGNHTTFGYVTGTPWTTLGYLTSYTETDPIWTSEKSDYLKLDQTTPQTTIGLFTFPQIKLTTGKNNGYLLTSDADGLATWTAPYSYTLPTATDSILGGVKIDGASITIADGVISSVGDGSSLWTASSSDIYYNSGNVGIGTTNPNFLVQISKDINVGTSYPGDNGFAQFVISGASNPNQRLAFAYDTTNNVGLIQSMIAGTGVKPLSLQPKGGYVGIGTTTPTNQLTLVTSEDIPMLITTSGNGYQALKIVSSAGDAGISLYNSNNVWSYQGSRASGAFNIIDRGSTGSSSNIKLTILKGTGFVGIGTTTPTEKLDVVGNIKFSGALMPNGLAGTTGQVLVSGGSGAVPVWTSSDIGSGGSSLQLDQTSPQATVGTFTFPQIKLTTGATNGYVLTSNVDGLASWAAATGGAGGGTWGSILGTITDQTDLMSNFLYKGGIAGGQTIIAGTGVTDILKLQGTTGDGTLTSPAISMLIGNNGATNALTILNNGNVGIGATNPGVKLEVTNSTREDSLNTSSTLDIVGTQITSRTDITVQDILRLHQPNTTLSNSRGSTFGIGLSFYEDPSNNYPRTRVDFKTTGKTTDNSNLVNTVMSLMDSGNVGIGTIAPKSKLDVNGSLAVGTYAGVTAAPANGMIISGNVGIGTTNPGSAFQLGNTGTKGNFRWVNGSNPYFGIYDSTEGLYFGFSTTLPAPSGTATVGGYYKGLGIGGSVAGTAVPIFGVLNSAQSGNGPGRVAMTVYANNKVYTYNNTLDDGSGGAMFVGTTGLTLSGAGANLAFTGTGPNKITTASGVNLALMPGGIGNVGIGTTNPTVKLDIVGDSATTTFALRLSKGNYSDGHTTFLGFNVQNTAAVKGAIGYTRTASYDRGYLGFYTNDSLSSGTGVSPSDVRMVINNTGYVGIGTTTPEKLLDVAGEGRFATGLTVSSLGTGALYSNAGVLTNTDPSDINLKQNILDINNSLSKILQLRPVSFEWKSSGEASQGFIAQEVENILPELVGSNPGGSKGLYTTRFIPYIVKAIQEQQSIINSLSFSHSNSVSLPSLNNLALVGGLSVSGHISFDDDTVGDVKILVGDKEVQILFEEKYLEKPIITATPQSDLIGSYWIAEVTENGFIIRLKEVQSSDVSFYWHAFAKKGDYFVVEPEVTPSPEPEVVPEIIPEVIPEVTLTPEPEPEAIPEVTPVPEPEVTPEVVPPVESSDPVI